MNDKVIGDTLVFDESLPAELPAKKPGKPLKRRKLDKSAQVLLRKRGRPPGTTKMHKVQTETFTKEQYSAIRILLNLSDKELAAVLEIVKGLCR
jgi:hypothetical protein